MEEKVYAVVRLRGSARMSRNARCTVEKLGLTRANSCIIVPASTNYTGMLRSAQDFVTWGGIREEVIEKMIEKRGRSVAGGRIDAKHAKSLAKKIIKEKTLKSSGIKPVFRLSPPSKGLKSVRLQYPKGDMGPRGETINELLLRMI
jgi:large subunit ribosomal protein L30